MSEQQKKEVVKEREEWVYIGQRLDGGKRSYVWASVNDIEHAKWFDKNLVTASVGNTYIVTLTRKEDGGTSVFTGGEDMPSYVGKYHDKAKITQWAIKDESVRQQQATKSMNTKASKESPLEDAFAHVRKMARNLNKTEKLSLISKLSEIILKA